MRVGIRQERRSRRFLLFCLPLACHAAHAASPTLLAVQAHKALNCAVVAETIDWNKEDLHGDLSPLGAEICRAVAVAALGTDGTLRLVQAPSETEALAALGKGQVDVAVGVTPSVSRGLRLGVVYGPPVFWDAQTVMVHRASGIHDAAGLAGRTVCAIEGTDNDGVLLATMQARHVAIRPFPFQEEGEMDAALTGSHCQAMTAYASKLAQVRMSFQGKQDFVLLGDRFAVSPAVVATRAGDVGWSAVVGATVDVLVQAEMAGVTRAGVAAAGQGDDPVVGRLVGRDWSSALALGLAHDWSARVIEAVGNYGEVYARSLGGRLPRGIDADCIDGGALCVAQVR